MNRKGKSQGKRKNGSFEREALLYLEFKFLVFFWHKNFQYSSKRTRISYIYINKMDLNSDKKILC